MRKGGVEREQTLNAMVGIPQTRARQEARTVRYGRTGAGAERWTDGPGHPGRHHADR